MKKIGLLSDTHSSLHPRAREFFSGCDEIWHAGDIGDVRVLEELRSMKPVRAVYGNIDGKDIRYSCPGRLAFAIEGVRVAMIHIGGYPGRYDPGARAFIEQERPRLFICGHSHILKIIYDKKYDMLCVNPGAAGQYGFHTHITFVRFVIDGKEIKDMEIMDIPRRREPGLA